jgi:hypothetical protein
MARESPTLAIKHLLLTIKQSIMHELYKILLP